MHVLTVCLISCLHSSLPQIQTLDIPGEVKAGYSPIGFVRCGRAACKITKINWKVRPLDWDWVPCL
jgi:elongation factor 1-alpha